jgi:hypothetical protein
MKPQLSIAFGAAMLCTALQAAAMTLPQPKSAHGVTYINGGVGQDESRAMKAEAHHYPLSMIFSAGKNDEYIADVNVKIRNQAGKEVLDAAAGPIMLVRVPAGTYAITADFKGSALHRTVHVGAKAGKEINFHWPKA